MGLFREQAPSDGTEGTEVMGARYGVGGCGVTTVDGQMVPGLEGFSHTKHRRSITPSFPAHPLQRDGGSGPSTHTQLP